MKLLDSEVLYLDNHLICVDKPPLLLTQPTNLEQDSVETRAKGYIKEKFDKPGAVFLHPVHRLDRVASGIVVCARTSKALSRLNEQIKKGEWEKTYHLAHEGVLPENEGELIHFLVREEYRTEVYSKEQPNSKKAVLHYKKIGPHTAEVRLFTGRYHQIRAQFAKIGCPIIGDEKYGAKKTSEVQGIALYHVRLSFIHPVTKEKLVVVSKKSLPFF